VGTLGRRHGDRQDFSLSRLSRRHRVEVRLTTHDAGGLTARDIELARRMEKISHRNLAK